MKKYQFIDNKTIITQDTPLEEIKALIETDNIAHTFYDDCFQDTEVYQNELLLMSIRTPEEEENYNNLYDTLKAEWGEQQVFNVEWYIKNMLECRLIEEMKESD